MCSPNLDVPFLSKDPSKSKVILRDFREAPFYVRLICRMLRQHSFHDTFSFSESSIEHRCNLFHDSNITKPCGLVLNDDALADKIEVLDAINVDLNCNKIVGLDSEQEEES